METRRTLWLDLEDTVLTPVLDGWFNTEVINRTKVQDIIKDFKPDAVSIFSFAIWNQTELEKFNQGTRPTLEQVLGVQFSTIPRVDEDIIPICCEVMGIHKGTVDFQEASNFWSKHQAFRLCLRHLTKNLWKDWQIETEVIFLDDAVFNETFEWPDTHVKGRILNIDTL
jgi:hypothetical protein